MFPCFIWRFLLKVRKPDSQSGNGLFDSAKRHQYGVMDKGKSLDSQSRGAWSFHAHVTIMVRSTSGLGAALSRRKRMFESCANHHMVAWTRESRPLLRREAVARMPPAITITHCATAVRKIQCVNASGSFVRCFPAERNHVG